MAGQLVQCPNCKKAVTASESAAPFAATPLAPYASAAPPAYAPHDPAYYEPMPDYTPPYPYYSSQPTDDGGAAAMAITSMVLGIVGFLVVFIPCVGWVIGGVMAVLGIIFSGIALSSGSKAESGNGFAITGMILSILTLIWVPLYTLVFMSLLSNRRF